MHLRLILKFSQIEMMCIILFRDFLMKRFYDIIFVLIAGPSGCSTVFLARLTAFRFHEKAIKNTSNTNYTYTISCNTQFNFFKGTCCVQCDSYSQTLLQESSKSA